MLIMQQQLPENLWVEAVATRNLWEEAVEIDVANNFVDQQFGLSFAEQF